MTIYFSLMIAMFLLSVPIAFAMITATSGYLTYVGGMDLIIIAHKIQESIDSFALLAVPFFILTGELMGHLGITGRLVELSSALVGPLRGSLGHVNVTTGMLMAGVSGSGTADAAALGGVLIPAMKEDGYDSDFAAALTAAAGSIGPVIPPSILMVVYGSLAEVSVGRLFLGGAVPGILMGLSLMIGVYVISRRRGYGSVQRTSVRRIARAFVQGLPALSIPVIIIGGIVGGVFTPTESGIIAVVATLVVGLISRTLSTGAILAALRGTIALLGPVMLVIAAAGVFGWILTAEQAGQVIAQHLVAVSNVQVVVLLVIVAGLLVLGCFIEVLSVLIILTPVLKPVLAQLAIDPVYFGVLMVFTLSIGLITPPVGLCMYVTCSIAKVSMEQYTKALLPFLGAVLVVNVLLVFFPQLIMFLPNLLMPVR